MELPGGGDSLGFGSISDVAVDELGRLYVLDSRLQHLQVYSPGGLLLQTVDRPGRGPGEFLVPERLWLDDPGRLYVLDRGNRRLSVFDVSGASLTFLLDIPLALDAWDVCGLRYRGTRLYVLGYWDRGVLHQVSLEGSILNTFGPPYWLGHGLLEEMSADGLIYCAHQTNLVLTVPHLVPEVRAFSPSGRRVWTTTIPRYERVLVRALPEGGAEYGWGPKGVYHTQRISAGGFPRVRHPPARTSDAVGSWEGPVR